MVATEQVSAMSRTRKYGSAEKKPKKYSSVPYSLEMDDDNYKLPPRTGATQKKKTRRKDEKSKSRKVKTRHVEKKHNDKFNPDKVRAPQQGDSDVSQGESVVEIEKAGSIKTRMPSVGEGDEDAAHDDNDEYNYDDAVAADDIDAEWNQKEESVQKRYIHASQELDTVQMALPGISPIRNPLRDTTNISRAGTTQAIECDKTNSNDTEKKMRSRQHIGDAESVIQSGSWPENRDKKRNRVIIQPIIRSKEQTQTAPLGVDGEKPFKITKSSRSKEKTQTVHMGVDDEKPFKITKKRKMNLTGKYM